MRARRLPVVAAVGVVLVLASSAAMAGPKYEITLDSGATYKVERLDDGSFQVENTSDEKVGSAAPASGADGGGGRFDVYDASGNLIGSADLINPDALELIDEHLRSGS